MHLLDPQSTLLLHQLESEHQIRRTAEANTGLKTNRPLMGKLQQAWEQLWAA